MKRYDEYTKDYIGSSDVACLTLTGFSEGQGVVANILHFGEDGDYSAYVVDGDAEIGSHYTLEAEFEHWVNIYDDSEKTGEYLGSTIRFFRAGNFGCVIQVLND